MDGGTGLPLWGEQVFHHVKCCHLPQSTLILSVCKTTGSNGSGGGMAGLQVTMHQIRRQGDEDSCTNNQLQQQTPQTKQVENQSHCQLDETQSIKPSHQECHFHAANGTQVWVTLILEVTATKTTA
ncbi:hypothetical protein E2C01_006507 [Portunus trituberculatus]|uniref:Uncharacterized protein n=1 Tax=Portunus trituberculatus TaxID=210409 RepID=A0A5B7D209_PORTR|nr:hypothetical protein [Portunus trituberculatus]